MTKEEFSNQFDVLFNNITSNQAPGLDEYEKSVFLTKAQDEILKSYFNPRLNKTAEGFDGNEKRQIDFSMVMKTVKFSADDFTDAILDSKSNTKRISLTPKASNIMMFVNEFADVTRGANTEKPNTVRLVVIPLSYQELSRLSSRPYKRPTHYQAWRVLDNVNSVNQVELIIGANDTLQSYVIRYIKRPYPIILDDFTSEDVSIEGEQLPYSKKVNISTDVYQPVLKKNPDYVDAETTPDVPEYIQDKNEQGELLFAKTSVITDSACELDPILHEEILQRAVELAKAAYTGTLESQIALGVNSETNMGVVPQARQ